MEAVVAPPAFYRLISYTCRMRNSEKFDSKLLNKLVIVDSMELTFVSVFDTCTAMSLSGWMLRTMEPKSSKESLMSTLSCFVLLVHGVLVLCYIVRTPCA